VMGVMGIRSVLSNGSASVMPRRADVQFDRTPAPNSGGSERGAIVMGLLGVEPLGQVVDRGEVEECFPEGFEFVDRQA
jgi:hypothetical protein